MIDYGSVCKFEDLKDIIMSTPEYTAPEILGLILCNYYNKKFEKEILLKRVLKES